MLFLYALCGVERGLEVECFSGLFFSFFLQVLVLVVCKFSVIYIRDTSVLLSVDFTSLCYKRTIGAWKLSIPLNSRGRSVMF